MKVRVVSDLHLDHFLSVNNVLPKVDGDEDTTLILSGDIHEGVGIKPYLDIWSEQFKYIIYVAGNHEYYFGVYEIVNDDLKDICNDYDNVFFLNRDHIELEGISFFGDTFWTPAGEDWENKNAKWLMNDFKAIERIHGQTGKNVRIDPDTYKYWFMDTIVACNEWLDNGFEGKRVIVSHHAPSVQSISKAFYGHDLNSFYIYNASKYLKTLENVVLYTHGHVHNSFDYTMRGSEETRIICNPRGYDSERNHLFNPILTVNI